MFVPAQDTPSVRVRVTVGFELGWGQVSHWDEIMLLLEWMDVYCHSHLISRHQWMGDEAHEEQSAPPNLGPCGFDFESQSVRSTHEGVEDRVS